MKTSTNLDVTRRIDNMLHDLSKERRGAPLPPSWCSQVPVFSPVLEHMQIDGAHCHMTSEEREYFLYHSLCFYCREKSELPLTDSPSWDLTQKTSGNAQAQAWWQAGAGLRGPAVSIPLVAPHFLLKHVQGTSPHSSCKSRFV